jgi:hypothetical protein
MHQGDVDMKRKCVDRATIGPGNKWILVAAILAAVWLRPAWNSRTQGDEPAADAKSKGAIYIVYPVASELQRLRLARSEKESPRLRAFVAISGNELIDGEGDLRPAAIPADDITNALAPYADRDEGVVVMSMQVGNRPDGKLITPSSAANEALQAALLETGRAAGFKTTIVSSTYGGLVLEKKLETAAEKVKGQADDEEKPSGDDLVMVYPVRTILSLLLTDNSDCVVVIRKPLEDDAEKLLSKEVREAVGKHVAAVKLRDKSKLQISVKIRGKQISNERLDTFISDEVAGISKSLGFESFSLQSSRSN